MPEKVFVVKEYNSDQPRNQCHQVVLTLTEKNSFKLLLSFYYNDWGDRVEESTLYQGKFQEDKEKFVCQSEEKLEVDRFWDHEMQDGHNRRKKEKHEECFVFRKEEEGVLCPLDYENFEGKLMLSGEEPQANVF